MLRTARRHQRHFVADLGLQQSACHRGHPADLALRAVGLVDAADRDGALLAVLVCVSHGRAEKHLLVPVVQRRVDDFGDVEPFGEEADAAVDFAQTLLAVQVVAVLGTVAVLGRPRHDLDDLGALGVQQVDQFVPQSCITGRRHVVLAARRQGRWSDVLIVVGLGVRLAGECLVHRRAGPAGPGTPLDSEGNGTSERRIGYFRRTLNLSAHGQRRNWRRPHRALPGMCRHAVRQPSIDTQEMAAQQGCILPNPSTSTHHRADIGADGRPTLRQRRAVQRLPASRECVDRTVAAGSGVLPMSASARAMRCRCTVVRGTLTPQPSNQRRTSWSRPMPCM